MHRAETSVVAMEDGDAIIPIPPEIMEAVGLTFGDHCDITCEGDVIVVKPLALMRKPHVID